MTQLLEFLPLIVFFLVYKMMDIYAAVMALMGVMAVSLIISRAKGKTISNMQWVSFALVLIFGGATLVLRNELFLKWKPTVLNWLFAVAFLGSQFIGKKLLIEHVMSAANLVLPRKVWIKLNLSWVFFFAFLGCLNLFVVYFFSTDVWVNFKVFGMLGLSAVFVLAQGLYISQIKDHSTPN